TPRTGSGRLVVRRWCWLARRICWYPSPVPSSWPRAFRVPSWSCWRRPPTGFWGRRRKGWPRRCWASCRGHGGEGSLPQARRSITLEAMNGPSWFAERWALSAAYSKVFSMSPLDTVIAALPGTQLTLAGLLSELHWQGRLEPLVRQGLVARLLQEHARQ